MGLQVEAGLDGAARGGRWTPVRVTATNNGAPVVGRVALALPGAQTALPLELPSSANKRVETVLVPQPPYGPSSGGEEQAVALLGDGRREVARAQARLRLVPDSERLLAVCSDDAGGLRFLDRVSLGESGWALRLEQQLAQRANPMTTAHLAPAQMPVDWAGLQGADLLVVRDVAWRRLEPEQRRAVRRWVEMGGRIVLCGEDPDGFRDGEARRLLPVQPAGLRPLPALTVFPLPGREPIRTTAGRVATIAARPLSGAAVVLREAGAPLVVTRGVGFGVALWLGFDPFRVPPGSLAGRRALWAFLIGQATGVEAPEPAFPHLEDVRAAADPVSRLPHFPAPSRWTLGSFGLVYVLLFGPVNIWLLRRLRRTVRAWLLMPALSLLLTGGVLALGSTWGRAHVVFHTLSVLESMAGSGTAREQNLAALFSPTNRAFGLEVEDPAPRLTFLSDEQNPGSSYLGGYPAAGGAAAPGGAETRPVVMPDTRDGALCRWSRIAFTLWTLQLFRTERAADLGGGVRLELDRRLAGRVINDTPQPLRDAYLHVRRWRYPLGDVAPGAAREVAADGWQRMKIGRPEPGGGNQERPGSDSYPRPGSAAPAGGVETQSGSEATDDLFSMAGSLILGSGGRSEVVLVARVPGLMLPLRVPGVQRSELPELPEGAILLVRQPAPDAVKR